MDFKLEELIKITGAKILKNEIDEAKTFSISTDTRTITNKNIYLPLVGEKFDGHNFIENAIQNGVLGYFTQNDIVLDNAKFILKVDNTLIAYLQIANYYKNVVNPKTIAITGSNGKTTTKEMAYSVFRQQFKTHKSELNHNNEIGLCQTLLSMPIDTEILIVEMGMRGLGEIELLSKYAEPDVAIISNIGTAHIGRLKSVENIAKAKFEITKYLKKDGILIANKSKYLDKINNIKNSTIYFTVDTDNLKIKDFSADFTEFSYKNNDFRINLSGLYNVQNSLAIIEAANYLNVTKENIQKGLDKFKPIENRWQVTRICNANIINDTYNANPDSMLATIKNFLAVYKGRKILVLGDMGELGENEKDYHSNIGKELKNLDFDILITIGNLAKYISDENKDKSIHFYDNKKCSKYLKENLEKDDWIFFKGSRFMKLETIIEDLRGEE